MPGNIPLHKSFTMGAAQDIMDGGMKKRWAVLLGVLAASRLCAGELAERYAAPRRLGQASREFLKRRDDFFTRYSLCLRDGAQDAVE
jgi:hypothetical protein